MNILIVDDQPGNLKLLRAQLEAEGHVVFEAADGVAALEQLALSPVDALITDILMPRMDGYRLCHEVRTKPTLRDVPVIVYTSTYTSPADERLARDVGADAYLRKPAAVAEMLDALHQVTTRRRATSVLLPPTELMVMKEYSERLVAKLEEKNVELLLRSTAMDTAANAVMITDPKGVIRWTNPAFTTLTGFTAEEAQGRTPRILKSGRHDQAFYKQFWATILSGKSFRGEFTNHRKDGTVYYDEHTVTPVRAGGGAITHFIGIMHDVTARKRAEEELRAAHAQCQMMLTNSPAVLYALRLEGDKIIPYLASENINALLGFTVAETLSMEWWLDRLHPEDREPALASIPATLAQGTSRTVYRLRHKDGSYRWVDDSRRLVRDATGQPVEFVGVWTDITERHEAEMALDLTRERLILATDSARMGIWDWDIVTNTLIWDARMYELYGIREQDFSGAYEAWQNGLHPDDREPGEVAIAAAIAGAKEFSIEFRVRWPNGEVRHIEAHAQTQRGPDGTAVRMIGANWDITDRKQAEMALRESEKRFKTLFEQAAVGVAQAEVNTGRFVHVNERFCRTVGYSQQELEDTTFAEITHPADVERSLEVTQQLKAGVIRESITEKRYVRKDGQIVWVNLTVSAMWAPGETPDYFIAVVQDITANKAMEAQFRQAQKMEAIGTLAGGIAHDFNNILGAIMGYAELAKRRVTGDPTLTEYLDAQLQGAHRAAALVRQILAFGRMQEQQRSIIQLRHVVAEPLQLLRSTIPTTIEINAMLANNLPPVLADPTQIHQIVMNLCTNAAHAMKNRPGRLEVRLEPSAVDEHLARTNPNLHPGSYVRLSVSDTGHGMDQATKDRIFEPFFTTKGPGEGTGLGLSVVYGIMKAHDGAITVYSQPGEGTVFHLYFPAHSSEPSKLHSLPAVVPLGHGETVLYVDDEKPLTLLARAMLEELGYVAVTVASPVEALSLVRSDPAKFALVITDLTMPVLTGAALAEQLLQIRPDLPIILTTGYTATLTPDTIKALGVRELLLKPHSLQSLGMAVHRALNSSIQN